jgi:hypothetical protein
MDRPLLRVDLNDVAVDFDVPLGEVRDDACIVIALVAAYG